MQPAPRSNDLYDLLSTEVREELARCEQARTVPEATMLMRHNVPPESLVILNAGPVEILFQAGRKTLSTIVNGEGQVFGLSEMLSRVAPDADIICRAECRVTFLPARDFNAILERHPEIYTALARILSTELRRATELLRNAPRRSAH